MEYRGSYKVGVYATSLENGGMKKSINVKVASLFIELTNLLRSVQYSKFIK